MSPPLEARSVGGVLIGRVGISYFVQAPYAGVSAFINTPAAEAERNACMLSVGVLVPLSYGRLGRSWRHAENLKGLAKCEIPHPRSHSLESVPLTQGVSTVVQEICSKYRRPCAVRRILRIE